MIRRFLLAPLFIVFCASLHAQNDGGLMTVNVSGLVAPSDSTQNVNPVKLFLKGHELPVSTVTDFSQMPLHVVFVLDNGRHQERLMPLAMDYVAKIAASIHVSQPNYTVLAATKLPSILLETSDASELSSALGNVKPPEGTAKVDSADLYAAMTEAVNILKSMLGVRVVVLLSDDDDNINGKLLQDLKVQMASTHTRCYSILLAQHDFFGTRARSASGRRLNSLANFSGGAQYETNWQNRQSDPSVLRIVAERISHGSIVTFTLPADLKVKPGIYTLQAQSLGTTRMIRTSPFVLPH